MYYYKADSACPAKAQRTLLGGRKQTDGPLGNVLLRSSKLCTTNALYDTKRDVSSDFHEPWIPLFLLEQLSHTPSLTLPWSCKNKQERGRDTSSSEAYPLLALKGPAQVMGRG